MHFRVIDGKKKTLVQAIRTQYSAEKKRGVQVIVGSFDPDELGVSEHIAERLPDATPAEVKEAQEWLAKRNEGIKQGGLEATVHGAKSMIRYIAKCLGELDTDKVVELFGDQAEFWAATDELNKALRKHGIKRPAKGTGNKPPAEPVEDPNQPPLFDKV